MGSLQSVLCHLPMVLVVKLSRALARQNDAGKPWSCITEALEASLRSSDALMVPRMAQLCPILVLCSGADPAADTAPVPEAPQGAAPQSERGAGAGLECGLNVCCSSVCLLTFSV